jgi:hypothetical protein
VRLSGRQQLLVFDIPNILVRPTRYIGDELTQTPIRETPVQRSDRFQ